MSCRVNVIHTASISVSSDDKGLWQMRVYDCESGVHGTSNLIAATPELCPGECLACTLGVMEPPRRTAKHGTKRRAAPSFHYVVIVRPESHGAVCTGCGAGRHRARRTLYILKHRRAWYHGSQSPRIPERRRQRYASVQGAGRVGPQPEAASRRRAGAPLLLVRAYVRGRGLLLCFVDRASRCAIRLPTPECRAQLRIGDPHRTSLVTVSVERRHPWESPEFELAPAPLRSNSESTYCTGERPAGHHRRH